MKASLTRNVVLKKLSYTLFFIALISWFNPAHAASIGSNTGDQALVFEIKSQSETNQQALLTYDELVNSDPLVVKLKNYLKDKNSPLEPYAADIIKLPQWQRALAISSVESGFCKYARNNNCGSLGVAPSHPAWRKYKTSFDGLKDLSLLLEKPLYKDKLTTCKKMMGVYVVPGSANWYNGCSTVTNELTAMTSSAEAEKISQVNTSDLAFAK